MQWETRLTDDLIQDYSRSGAWPGRLLCTYVRQHALRTPDKIAVVDGEKRLTYAALNDLVDHLAMGLLGLGLGPRDTVSVQLPNCSEFVLSALAVERIGGIVNPISTIMRERELTQMLSAAGSRVIVVPDTFRGFDHARAAVELRQVCRELLTVLTVGTLVPSGATAWDDFVGRSQEERVDRELLDSLAPNANDVVLVAFTSGTTGVPKGVMHTNNTMHSFISSSVRRQGFSDKTSVFMASPLGHGTGYYWGVRMPLMVGGKVAYQATWEPGGALQIMEAERTTFSIAAPTFLTDFLSARDLRRRDLTSLEVIMCGGANVPPVLLSRATEALGCRIYPVFGMTENGIVSCCDTSTPMEKVLSTDGSPQPEIALRIVDAEGRDMPAKMEGRLLVRGPFNFVGYTQGLAFTQRYFVDGDWFDTGDVAYLDPEGFVRLTGRTKDLIIRGGENIPVKEIEDALTGHPAIREVAVIGIPDERLGEKACACVICNPNQTIDLDEMRRYLAAMKVAKPFWPELVAVYQELPRTPSGKVQKFLLRDSLTKRTGPPEPTSGS